MRISTTATHLTNVPARATTTMLTSKVALRIVRTAKPGVLMALRHALRVGPAPLAVSLATTMTARDWARVLLMEDARDKAPKDDAPAKEEPKEKDPKDNEVPKNDPKDDDGPKDDPADNGIEIVLVKNKSAKRGNAAAAGGAGAPPLGLGGPGDGNNGQKPPGEGDSEPAKMEVNPDTGLYPLLLAISMKDRIPLPGRPFAINVTDPEVIDAIHTIIDKREPYFVFFHVRDAADPDTDVIRLKLSVHDIGVHCQIIRLSVPRPGFLNVLAYPLERCQLQELTTREANAAERASDDDLLPLAYLKGLNISCATVKPVADEPYDKDLTEIALLVELLKVLMNQLALKNPLEKLQHRELTKFLLDPSKFADYIGSLIHGDPKKIQEILELLNIEERLSKVLELLKIEVKASMIKENTIHNLSAKADEYQTRLFIKEFIKELQKRAGISELENSKTHKFDERLQHLKMTEEALEAYNAEKQKMELQNEHLSELGVSERYLDWLTLIPWGIYSQDRFNIKEAKTILDRDHYGLKDVKERILEFISMGRVLGKVDGKILCLLGPPGTGKTLIAKLIAEALNRKYVRIAMGGIQDVHEVKGHRRTYVGSIPGRIIFALKQAKTLNPLMLIDEIDKLDLLRLGGAALAFLEILDPEQNNAFVDNYIDVKVDLSKVLFVCTANYLGNIPPPLRDRMEIIDVLGYTNNEKIEIAKRHLIPDALKKAGLESSHVNISDDTISRLIEKYCRELGLRNIKKLITRIFSKASLKIVEMVEEREAAAQEKEAKTAKEVAETKETESKDAKEPESKDAKESEIGVATDKDAKDAKKEPKEPKEAKDKEAKDPKEAKDTKEANESKDDDAPVPMEIPADINLEVTPANLKDYVGPEIYTRDRVYELPPPGVATGLSYLTLGNGDALYIESILTHSIALGLGHAGVHVTGSLKDVMKELAQIAYSFAKLYMVKNFPDNRFFEAAEIHVHCPDGAIPKDGPSAGISFTSSLISLALNQLLPPTVAMTGEITVTGRVLPVGGLREKILGAKRYGCDTIIFPKDIENELEEIPTEVKEGVKFIPVEWYLEVFDNLFPSVTPDNGNNVWAAEFAKLDEKKKSKN